MKTQVASGIRILPISYSFEVEDAVINAQREVFDHFGLTINQEVDPIPHGVWLGKKSLDILDNHHDKFDMVVFFDLDCIPITKHLYNHLVSKTILNNNSVCGIEQTCESNQSNGHIYAGPACLAIPKSRLQEVYRFYQRLSFVEDKYSDVAQRFTYDCESIGIPMDFLRVTSCADPRWRIGKTDIMFGVGTTYDKVIYHHFLIGREPWRRPDFVRVCNNVIRSDSQR